MSQSAEQALKFTQACSLAGFDWDVNHNGIITITRYFTPNDRAAFAEADSAAFGILGLAPLRGGSVWGTDGGSVGGYVGLKDGRYVLNKSGEGKRFVGALRKLFKGSLK
jgi:hypothetical protein